MRKLSFLTAILLTALFAFNVDAQRRGNAKRDSRDSQRRENTQGRESFTGTLVYYGSGANTRTGTTQFKLDITGETSDDQAKNYLDILKSDGQDEVLDAIDDQEVGRFSVGSNIGIPVNVVRENDSDGNRRIFVVFKRWTQFAEFRYGYRSRDYPFGVVELRIDQRTGKGEGTYIAAAKIRFDDDNGRSQVEIENFATYPARLLGVTSNRQKQ